MSFFELLCIVIRQFLEKMKIRRKYLKIFEKNADLDALTVLLPKIKAIANQKTRKIFLE